MKALIDIKVIPREWSLKQWMNIADETGYVVVDQLDYTGKYPPVQVFDEDLELKTLEEYNSMNKRIHNTLEGFEPEPGRCKGNTTRQVDKAIQILFNEGAVKCLDHCQEGGHRPSNEWLFDRVRQRLQAEHRVEFSVDKPSLIISLKQNG